MKKIFKNSKTLEILAIFILSLTPLLWLKAGEIILGHDSGFRLDPTSFYKSLYYSWNPINNFGIDLSLFKGFLVTQLPEVLFTYFSDSLTLGQIVTFIFWFFLMGISMYVLINSLFAKRKYWIVRVLAPTLYIYNFFLLQAWFIAERAKFSLYAALPLGLLVIINTFSRKYSLIKGAIIFSLLFLFLNGGGSPPNFGAVLITYTIAFLYLTLVRVLEKGTREILFSLKAITLFLIGPLILNAYWTLPALFSVIERYSSTLLSIGGVEGVLSWEKTVNRFASLANLFRLQGIPDWYGEGHPYSHFYQTKPLLILGSFIPLLIIILGSFTRKTKVLILFLLIFFWGAIFTAGTHPPFGFIYEFLVKNFPGFAIFRTSFYKFGAAFWFAYSFLLGYFLNIFLLKIKKPFFRFSITIICLLGILLYHFPYFSDNFFSWNPPFITKVRVPKYVYETSKYLSDSDINPKKILILPRLDERFLVDSYEWGYFGLDILPRLFSKVPIIANDNQNIKMVSSIYESLQDGTVDKAARLASLAGIDTILWRDDVLYNDKKTGSSKFSYIERYLEKEPFSRKFENGPWKIYKIEKEPTPDVYAASEVYLSTTSEETLKDLVSFSNENSLSVFVFTEIREDAKKLEQLLKGIYLEAECVFCAPGSFENLSGGIALPVVRFLPDSEFYFLVTRREGIQFAEVSKNPEARIDFDLALANKRLAEIAQILEREKEIKKEHLLIENIEKYKENIEDSFSQTELLSEQRKNFYLIRILSFMQAQVGLLVKLDQEKDVFNNENFASLGQFISEKTNYLKENIWITESDLNQKFYLELNNTAEYQILLSEPIGVDKILIDGQEVNRLDKIRLESGVHRLQVLYKEPQNLLTGDESRLGETINLSSGQERVFKLENLDISKDYLIRLDYKVLEGQAFFLEVEGKHDKIEERLAARDWRTFYYVLSPDLPDEEIKIKIALRGFKKSGTIQIKDLRIGEFSNLRIFLDQSFEREDNAEPSISIKKKNPSEYLIQVEKAKEPFLLVFSEGFSEGWRLYIDKEETPKDKHFKVNGYANAWLVDKKGKFQGEVVYLPQRRFETGLFISILGVIAASILLWKHWRSS